MLSDLTRWLLEPIKKNEDLKQMYLELLDDDNHDCKLLDPDKNWCDCMELIEYLNE